MVSNVDSGAADGAPANEEVAEEDAELSDFFNADETQKNPVPDSATADGGGVPPEAVAGLLHTALPDQQPDSAAGTSAAHIEATAQPIPTGVARRGMRRAREMADSAAADGGGVPPEAVAGLLHAALPDQQPGSAVGTPAAHIEATAQPMPTGVAQRGIRRAREMAAAGHETCLLLPRGKFARIVREIAEDNGAAGLRFHSRALEALQEAAEAHVVGMFEDAFLIANHAKRVTVMPKDMQLAQRLTGR